MTKYEQLASIKKKIKDLQDQEAELTEECLEQLLADGVSKMKTSYGTISVAKRKAWEWPDNILQEEEEIKLRKKNMQRKGLVDYSETPYLQVRTPKPIEPHITRNRKGRIHT